jgi:hypothetical protein
MPSWWSGANDRRGSPRGYGDVPFVSEASPPERGRGARAIGAVLCRGLIMTTRDEIQHIRHHPIWELISRVRDSVKGSKPVGTTDRETLARVEAVLSYAAGYRSSTPYLLPSSWSGAFSSIESSLTYLEEMVAPARLNEPLSQNTVRNIDIYLDQILENLGSFPSLQKESRAKAIADTADAYRTASDAAIAALEDKVAELQEEISAGRQTVNELVHTARRATDETEATRREFESTLEEADSKAREALDSRLSELVSTAKSYQGQARKASEEVVAALREKEAEAKTLLEHVADASVAGGYQKYAKKEVIAFRFWNALGLGIAGVVAVYLAVRFWNIESLTVQESILRAVVSLPALALAAYCLRQASVRQKQSVEAKYRELDLLALPPFTEKMDAEQKSQLRMLLGERIFGHPVIEAADDR